MLSDMKFLDSLKEYDKDNIPPQIITKIRNSYIKNPDFNPSLIKSVSSACEGLCKWVIAISSYDEIYKDVAPKKNGLLQAQDALLKQMFELDKKRNELAIVTNKLQVLYDNLAAKQIEQRELESKIKATELKLERAERLINGLSGEKARWTTQIKDLTHTYDNIVGDVLLSSAIVAYLGAFTFDYRQDCIKNWLKICRDKYIPCSKGFSLIGTLGDPVKIREWQLSGLPVDTFSIENAMISLNAFRWPLMIDPQSQANKWIKNMEKQNNLQVIKQDDKNLMRILENCIQFGQPLLIEDIEEEIDSLLDPVLLKLIFKQNSVDYIKLGENTIEYSNGFKLYFTTRLKRPNYLPEVSVKVKLINFVITPMGLQDQLLGMVTRKEKPELEEIKNQLIIQSAHNRRQLKDIEDKILEVLSASKGDILEDETAIEVLSSSKVLAHEIAVKQETANKTEQEIDKTRNFYKTVATHSSVIFFTISDLANIDPMYQFSLNWMLSLFELSIENCERSDTITTRIRSLNSHFTFCIYKNVCQALFEKDKLLFSFILCTNLMKMKFILEATNPIYFNFSLNYNLSGDIESSEWRFFLTGGLSLDDNPYENPCPHWLNKKSWSEVVKFSEISKLPLIEHVKNNKEKWESFYNDPEKESVPYDKFLTKMQKLIILRIFRPDRILNAIQKFITDQMGSKYTEPPGFSLSSAFNDSAPHIPLVFLLSPGVDPLSHIYRLALEKDMNGKIHTISLGQGQGVIALRMIEDAQKNGWWVVLQNCHLAISFLKDIERICSDLLAQKENLKVNFRLWLTSYPTEFFPVSVLENSVKMTNEPPQGLRSNLLRSYMNDPVSDLKFFESSNKPKQFKKLLFGLCFFHAVIQERIKYGPLGWNIPYEFNESDLKISVRQLKLYVDKYDNVPFDALSYVTSECNYGGRVTDYHDRRLINSLLNIYYCPEIISSYKYKFCSLPGYNAPNDLSYDGQIEFIRHLPTITLPEALGLHSNAKISRDYQETQFLFRDILLTMPRENSLGKSSNQEIIEELAKDILSKLPNDFDIKQIQQKFPTLYEESMNIVLVQELVRFNALLFVIKDSISDIKKAVNGQIVMSNTLEEVYNSIIAGNLPELWASKSYPSLKSLGSYIVDLCERIKFFNEWVKTGDPKVYWLPGFFFAQSFLTGTMQNHARKYKIPIDLIKFKFQFMSDEKFTQKAPEGAYIYGLFLQGARWSRESNILQESHEKIIFDSLPTIWLKPVNKIDDLDLSSKIYQCPVYKTTVRRGILSTTGHSTNYVLTLEIPSDKSESHWINRGVAAICQLDD